MLMIRLIRVGRKNQPYFRIGVIPKREAAQGQAIEVVGSYNPRAATKDKLNLKAERIQYWLDIGAQPSTTVHNLLVDGGILKDKLILHSLKRKKKKDLPAGKAGEEKKPEKPPEKIEPPKIKETKQAASSLMEQGVEQAIKEEEKKEEVKEKIEVAKEETESKEEKKK